jgi:hypothetical protein
VALTGRMTYRVFGVNVAVPDGINLRANPVQAEPDVTVHVVEHPPAADWPLAQELYATEPPAGRDEPDFRFYRLPDRDIIRVVGTGDVHLTDAEVLFHLVAPDRRFLIEVILLGLAMAFWLERRGTATLHGSAVRVGGDGVGFVAAGGTGKSSLAAYLTANGDHLVTEDLLALSWNEGTPLVEPAVGQIRLWPEVAARYSSDWRELPRPHPRYSKRLLLIGPDGIGELSAGPVPLRRIYVLQRTDRPGYQPTVVRLGAGDGLAELLRHSYLPEISEAFGWQVRRLSQLVELLGAAPVRLLRYGNGLEQLPAVRAAIVDDLDDRGRTSSASALFA